VVSPGRRLLLRDGVEIPLIPRYLDLLILLLRRREEAVTRRDIFEVVWSDVVVSDGALSQAVRTLRRALGDDVRNPVFIRTVSRHGYRFTFPDVIEEPDRAAPASPTPPAHLEPAPSMEQAVSELTDEAAPTEDRRAAAETLLTLGADAALEAVASAPNREAALALLRDARWAVPGAGEVPLAGQPGGTRAASILVRMRLRDAARQMGSRWAAAALGGALAGVAAGLIGGLALRLIPGSVVPATIPVVFAFIGACIGFLGAGGVGAGLAFAEAVARSYRGTALAVFGALGGGAIGAVVHILASWILADLFGREITAIGGGIDGLAIGAAAGIGYALSTPRPEGGMATPRGARRWIAAALTGGACALAGVLLAAAGRTLGAGSLDLLARSFQGSHAGLAAIGALVGEDGLGPTSRLVLNAFEGFLFGLGLVLGITHRPRS